MATHPSDSSAQMNGEALVLKAVASEIGVELTQKVRLQLDEATAEVDGAATDETVLVEVFSRIGPLKGAQLHKVSTDTLKLVALGESRPNARLVLAFADQAAADSVVGWRAAVLKAKGIERIVVDLDAAQRDLVLAAQDRQKMVNVPADVADPE